MADALRDGGVIDDAELIRLARRTAEELRALPVEPAASKQLRAVATVIDALAARLLAPAPDVREVTRALEADDPPLALAEARRVASIARAELPEPDWNLFA